MLKQYDIIQITTTKRIRYVSGPKNKAATPQGYWSVVALLEADVLAARENTIVRVPITDVQKVAGYNLNHFFDELKTTGLVPKKYFNVSEAVSTGLGIDIATARKLIVDHNLKITTQSEQEQVEIVKKAKELWQRKQH